MYSLPDIICHGSVIESKAGLARREPVKVKASEAMMEFVKDADARILILHEDDSYTSKWAWLCLCLWRRLYHAAESTKPFLGRLTVTMWVRYYSNISHDEFGEYPDTGLSCQMIAMNRAACIKVLNTKSYLKPGSFDIFSQITADDRWCIYPHICQHSALRSTWNKLPLHRSRYFRMDYRPGVPGWLKECVPDVDQSIVYAVIVALAYFDYLAIPPWSLEKDTITSAAERIASLYRKSCCITYSDNWNIAVCDYIPEYDGQNSTVLVTKAPRNLYVDGWYEMINFGNRSVLFREVVV